MIIRLKDLLCRFLLKPNIDYARLRSGRFGWFLSSDFSFYVLIRGRHHYRFYFRSCKPLCLLTSLAQHLSSIIQSFISDRFFCVSFWIKHFTLRLNSLSFSSSQTSRSCKCMNYSLILPRLKCLSMITLLIRKLKSFLRRISWWNILRWISFRIRSLFECLRINMNQWLQIVYIKLCFTSSSSCRSIRILSF